MQLNGFTDLALRVVMRLAVLDETEKLGTAKVAAELNSSPTHAAKVVAVLNRMGIVEARRGRGSGVRLAAGAGSTSVGYLVRQLEGDKEVVNCDGPRPCPLRNGCRLRSALAHAQESFYAALDPITLDDLVSSPTGPLLLSLIPQAVTRPAPPTQESSNVVPLV